MNNSKLQQKDINLIKAVSQIKQSKVEQIPDEVFTNIPLPAIDTLVSLALPGCILSTFFNKEKSFIFELENSEAQLTRRSRLQRESNSLANTISTAFTLPPYSLPKAILPLLKRTTIEGQMIMHHYENYDFSLPGRPFSTLPAYVHAIHSKEKKQLIISIAGNLTNNITLDPFICSIRFLASIKINNNDAQRYYNPANIKDCHEYLENKAARKLKR